MIIKHIKKIGLNSFKIFVLSLFVSCGNNTNKDIDRLKEVNTLRSKKTKCNGVIYPKENNLSEIDNCLSGIYAYDSSIQIDTINILDSLDSDLDCEYVLGGYVQYISFDKDIISTCGNPPIEQ